MDHVAPPLEPSLLVEILNRCIQTSIDAERMFASSASDAQSPELRALFVAWAKQRTDFVFALQSVVEMLGGEPRDEGTVEGALDRSYALLVRRAAPPSDRVVLIHAERHEKRARKSYVALLQDPLLGNAPPTVLDMLRRQYDAIRHVHDDMRRRLAYLG